MQTHGWCLPNRFHPCVSHTTTYRDSHDSEHTEGNIMYNTAEQLITGYLAYTDSAEFGASAVAGAPESTPVLSSIAVSTAACGGAVSAVTSAAVTVTAHVTC